jgi:hypothetical protein
MFRVIAQSFAALSQDSGIHDGDDEYGMVFLQCSYMIHILPSTAIHEHGILGPSFLWWIVPTE